MMPTETLPGLYRQTTRERLDQIEIPLGWVRSIESFRPYATNLAMLLGTSGTGRDSLLDAIRDLDPRYQRVRRTTTRPNRNPYESQRIISVDREQFARSVAANSIICPFLYSANGQWYGIPIEELKKISDGPALLEGTSELLPLRALLPEARLYVVLPENLSQLFAQLNDRDGAQPETRRRIFQATRELCSLLVRVPTLVQEGLVDGVIVNASPLEVTAEQAMRQLQEGTINTEVPTVLADDIYAYLSTWR